MIIMKRNIRYLIVTIIITLFGLFTNAQLPINYNIKNLICINNSRKVNGDSIKSKTSNEISLLKGELKRKKYITDSITKVLVDSIMLEIDRIDMEIEKIESSFLRKTSNFLKYTFTGGDDDLTELKNKRSVQKKIIELIIHRSAMQKLELDSIFKVKIDSIQECNKYRRSTNDAI